MTERLQSFCGFSGIITYISKLFWTDGWIEFLRDKLNNEDFIIALQNSPCYSGPLVKSMVDCYFNRNFYAAYTLGSLAIDGALNRISEMISSRKKIPVWYKAVEESDAIFIDKSFRVIGLMHWLFNFFKDTKGLH